MITRIWTKQQTQKTIKALRLAGYAVNKVPNGYESTLDDNLIFKAMIGTRGYLIRYDANLFS
jgi:hypothetical protein